MLLGSVAWMVDEHDAAQRRLAQAAELMLRADAPGELPQTLLALGLVRFEMGRWDDAEETARLLSDVAEARGLEFLSHAAAELQARVAAVRGDATRAVEILQAIEAAVDPGEWVSLTCDLIRTRGLLALGAGDHALAYAHLRGPSSTTTAPRCTGARPCSASATSRLAAARTGRADRGGPADRLGVGPRRRAPQRARRDDRGPSRGERLRRGRRAARSSDAVAEAGRGLAVRAGHRPSSSTASGCAGSDVPPTPGTSCRRR